MNMSKYVIIFILEFSGISLDFTDLIYNSTFEWYISNKCYNLRLNICIKEQSYITDSPIKLIKRKKLYHE